MDGRRHARWCAIDRIWSDSAENCGVPQLQYSDKVVHVPAVAVHRQGVDVPAIMQRRSPAVGGASDSAHRWSQRTSQLQQRRIRFQRGDGDEWAFFWLFWPFFALFRVVPELSASFRVLDDEEFFVIEGSHAN